MSHRLNWLSPFVLIYVLNAIPEIARQIGGGLLLPPQEADGGITKEDRYGNVLIAGLFWTMMSEAIFDAVSFIECFDIFALVHLSID
eukprot:SAG31_NODE_7506_length_1669_cov_2.182166_2_plen_87_part_00